MQRSGQEIVLDCKFHVGSPECLRHRYILTILEQIIADAGVLEKCNGAHGPKQLACLADPVTAACQLCTRMLAQLLPCMSPRRAKQADMDYANPVGLHADINPSSRVSTWYWSVDVWCILVS